ncbi:50S ribosomal protein L25/general stress protein Ctc [Bacillus timonensis]|nr:50S ribosomal protein L25/general stress protein Ctc [Bacillus timonensis]
MPTMLEAKPRTEFKNSAKRKIREQGNFPAIVNGQNESKPIYVNSIEFVKTIRETGRNGIILLNVDQDKHSVMLHDLQVDPLKNEVIHADFQIVNMKKEVEVQVNVHLIGDAQGVKDGGVLQQSIHQVSVRSLPNDIPASIDIDVTSLTVGDTVTIGDIQTNGSYELNHELSEVIASILPPKQEEEINSGEEQEPGQPEAAEGRETSEE